jgi:predicted transposase/invertase (TIGR01784 family)
VVRRDAIFYQIFQRYPDLIFELIDRPLTPTQGYRFDSVEVKETSFRIDGVFLPPVNATSQLVIFAEVQFQRDEALYHRFFTESLTYLYRNQGRYDDWYGVILFQSRSLEPSDAHLHRSLLEGTQVQRIYLDELKKEQSLGISLLQLTIASEADAPDQAKRLLNQAQTERSSFPARDIIEIVSTILVYKFSSLSREEVESMLGLHLEETRIYRDLKAEAVKASEVKIVKAFARKGFSIEEIMENLELLTLEEVQQIIQQLEDSVT